MNDGRMNKICNDLEKYGNLCNLSPDTVALSMTFTVSVDYFEINDVSYFSKYMTRYIQNAFLNCSYLKDVELKLIVNNVHNSVFVKRTTPILNFIDKKMQKILFDYEGFL